MDSLPQKFSLCKKIFAAMLGPYLPTLGRLRMQAEPFTASTWRDSTRDLLNNRPASLTIAKIAEDCDVSEGWLRLFARGKIENPGVATVECLHKYLSAYKA